MERRVFRIFFWQKLTPFAALPVFAIMFMASPIDDGWSRQTWLTAGGIFAAIVAFYLAMQWRNSDVVLDDDGLHYHVAGGRQTWPYEKLLNVRQIGKYRVKLCFDPDIPDKHWHVTFDLFNSDAFVDEMMDRYEAVTGEILPDDTHALAA
jgi:hypothetical protein